MESLRRFAPARRIAAGIMLLAYLQGCMSWRVQPAGPAEVISQKHPKEVRIVLASGATMYLKNPQIVGDSLVGNPIDSLSRPVQPAQVALAEVKEIQVSRVDGLKTAGLVVGLGLTAVLIVAAAEGVSPASAPQPCIPNDPNCISCPLVYSWDGQQWRLDSGTFGGAWLPGLARVDVDNLLYPAEIDGTVRLRVANQRNESDHLDALSLLAVDHPANLTVAPDGDGRLHTLGEPAVPQQARDFRGADALGRVRANDGWNWESNPGGRDTSVATDIRDGLELEFTRPENRTSALLVVEGHNTPWAAYLMRDFIAAHGRETGAWYDSLGRNPAAAGRLRDVIAKEAFLGVSVWVHGRWERRGMVMEAGPEIAKRQVVPLDLTGVEGGMVRLRLESAPSLWLIDQVALDYSTAQPIAVHELQAETAVDGVGRDVGPYLARTDGSYFTLETGDAAELSFRVPPVPAGQIRSYLVRSRGWYRIRTAESGEPDRALLGRLATDPRAISKLDTARLTDALKALSQVAR